MPYTRPGVYVSESPMQSAVTRRDGTGTAAFIGTAERGPTTPTLIDSWAAYQQTFGKITNAYDLGYAVYSYFANGGRVCYVTRAVGASSSVATNATIEYNPVTSGAGSTAASVAFTLSARSAGTWANSAASVANVGLVATPTAGVVTPTSTVYPTFNLVLSLNGSEVESWTELSLDPTSSRYVATILNEYSAYVTVSNVLASPGTSAVAAWDNLSTSAYFTGGNNGATVLPTGYTNALDTLASIEEPIMINVVGISDATVVNAALAKAEARGDSFVIVDPVAGATTAGAVTAVTSTYSTSTGYGAVYYPMLKMLDPAKTGIGAIRNCYPGGAVAGIYSRMERERTVAKAPAGFGVQIANAIGLETPYTESVAGTLYEAGVNTFRAIPGGGISINGARTLKKNYPDKYIPIRRSLNYVKSSVKSLTQFAVFEPNDERLWGTIEARLNRFLTDFWGSGGLRGRTADEAFYILCNDTNNTNASIASGQVNVEVGVSLLYPAEFIVINVSQWIGGANTAENL
jgi:phage tail sheath protein FI